MKRIFFLLLVLTLLPLCGMAEAPLTFADDLNGVYLWPEGASEADATYVYRYAYPQMTEDNAAAQAFNLIYQYEVSDALGYECPMIASDRPAELGQMQVDITYSITHQSAEALSIRIDKKSTEGGEVTHHDVKGHTFSLTGAFSGMITSLPYLLDQLEPGETDEWLINRQTAKADTCVRELVWMLIEQDMKAPDSPIYPEFTEEDLAWSFYPEEDFFLDEAGNFVFFLQPGVIAPAEYGPFCYTLTLEELLDEI